MKAGAFVASLVAASSVVGSGRSMAQVRVDAARSGSTNAQVRVSGGPVAVTVGSAGVSVRVGAHRAEAPTRSSTTRGTTRTKAGTRAARVLSTADRYVGTRYVYGGTTPKGFDCSGFVQYVFRKHGVSLPRTSREQAAAGRKVSARLSALRAGDLLLFATKGKRIDHVAIYAGGNRIIHASASGGSVRYDTFKSKRWKSLARHHVASRRVLTDGARLAAE